MRKTLDCQTVGRMVVLAIVVTASGCMTAWKRVDVPASADLSTSTNTAVIRGSRSGMNGLDCYISGPSSSRELIVDAGEVSIRVTCYSWSGQVGESMHKRIAKLSFRAREGHTYELVGYSTCMGCGKRSRFGFEYVDLIDSSDGKRSVLSAPFGYDVKDTRAVVYFRRQRPSAELPCVYLDKASPPGEIAYIHGDFVYYYAEGRSFKSTRIDDGHLELPPTPQTISVQCTAPTGRKWNDSAGGEITATFRAEFKLTAEPGHMYGIYMPDDGQQCVQVRDVFERKVTVECIEADKLRN